MNGRPSPATSVQSTSLGMLVYYMSRLMPVAFVLSGNMKFFFVGNYVLLLAFRAFAEHIPTFSLGILYYCSRVFPWVGWFVCQLSIKTG